MRTGNLTPNLSMSITNLLPLGGALLLGTAALAQNCDFNVYPIRMVDALGAPRPVTNEVAAYAADSVFVAFHAAMPTGTYYVHVTDPSGFEVLSTNDPMDRFVSITNTNGVIALSLPYTNNPDPTLFGTAADGVSQTLKLASLRSTPAWPCQFLVQVGDHWILEFGPEWPWVIRGGTINPATNQCTIASFHQFRIGDGSGGDVTGTVFVDSDRDGVRDPGEGPAADWQVRLVTDGSSVATSSGTTGGYAFADVPTGSYSVELVLKPGFVATAAATVALEHCGCADTPIAAFGVAPAILACDGHGIGYWRNKHGLRKVHDFGMLATLPALQLRGMFGSHVAPSHLLTFDLYLTCANSLNMAYMLSAQLLAMHCNVLAGFVDPNCVIRDKHLGNISVANLMQQAIVSLSQHGFTVPGHPRRKAQERLKNALDNANNNRNWL